MPHTGHPGDLPHGEGFSPPSETIARDGEDRGLIVWLGVTESTAIMSRQPLAEHSSSLAITSECLALVDLFNVVASPKTERDYAELLDLVAGLVTRKLAPSPESGQLVEVSCRLYGGFTNRNGSSTEQYSRTLQKIRFLRTRENRVSIRPEIALSLACRPGSRLVGTYKNQGQKMVDQMLAQDLYHLAESGRFERILLIGDDEDYVPVVMSLAARGQSELIWLRFSENRLNDHHFGSDRVTFVTDGEWAR